MTWRIYYEDDTHDGDELPPPPRRVGIVLIAQVYHRTGREVVRGDYYYRKNGVWYGADIQGLLDQEFHHREEIDCVMAGRMVDHDTFDRLFIAACDDPGLPPKSARRPTETRLPVEMRQG